MQKLIGICLVLLVCFVACKSKKKDLSGEEPVTVEDFIGFFQEVSLPYNIADTQISKKLPDSLLISQKVFKQFVPDTVITNDYGKKSFPKLYALGKITDNDKETYVLVKAATAEKQVGYILCFDKDNIFKAAMPLVRNNPDRNKSITGSIDKKLTITTSEKHKVPDGQNLYKLNAYVYNNVGVFTLIKIESNEVVVPKEVYNPIDTFARKHKLSGDYIVNKKNFVSVRDGRDEKRLLFFIHFEIGKDGCTGELKGEAVLVKPNIAQFRQVGDPCILQLSFSGNKVTLNEVQACGNYRGIKCAFEGVFLKKKEPVAIKKKA
ncbi:MAG: hypothetical protein IT249_00410 [Chitinophagaceae bacterium]|nr:hypothetical protein [Chitinophagaceae bacterium]